MAARSGERDVTDAAGPCHNAVGRGEHAPDVPCAVHGDLQGAQVPAYDIFSFGQKSAECIVVTARTGPPPGIFAPSAVP